MIQAKNFSNKELVLSSAFMIVCLALALFFPVSKGSAIQAMTKGFFFLVVIPFLYIRLILKRTISQFGLNLDHKKEGLLWGTLMLAIAMTASIAIFQWGPSDSEIDIPAYAQANFWLFLVYELIFVNILLFTYEFFWRGFVLFTYSEKFGYWAIAIQAAFFIILSFFNEDFYWKFYSLPILSVLSGFVAIRTKSFVYSYAASLLFMILFDSYLIYSLNK